MTAGTRVLGIVSFESGHAGADPLLPAQPSEIDAVTFSHGSALCSSAPEQVMLHGGVPSSVLYKSVFLPLIPT